MNPQYGGKLRELKRRIGRGRDFGNTWSLAAQLQWVGFSREERSFDSAFRQSRANFEGNDCDECLLDCCESLIEIVHDVFDVFDSYGDADHSIRDADVFPSLFADSAVRHGGRV